MALAHQPLTRWQELTGWQLDVPAQMGRLLRQHQQAIVAELAGQWQRADFFWQQVQIELNQFSKQEQNWSVLAAAIAPPEASIMNDPVQLRQQLVQELLIDTHLAFYYGRQQQVEKLDWRDRAFIHINYIQQFLSLSGLTSEVIQTLLSQPWQTRITRCKETKQWKRALQLCQQRLHYLPQVTDYQNEAAEISFQKALAKLQDSKSASKSKLLANAASLTPGIQNLEKLLKDYPYNLRIFEFIGYLHHQRSIFLANGGKPSDALLSAQKALTYDPDQEQYFETRNEIVQLMHQFKSRAQELQTQLSQNPNASLNPEGQQLVAQAQWGFDFMNSYTVSTDAQNTTKTFNVARAINLWRIIGLPEPETGWQAHSDQAIHLWDGVCKIWNNPPADSNNLAAAWEEVVTQKTDLVNLDRERICSFLDRRLFSDSNDRVLIPPPPDLPQPPILAPITTKPKFSTEPFLPWVFSRQNFRIKLQAAIATLLILTTGGLVIHDRLVRSAKDIAYQKLLVAQRQQNHLDVMKSAEAFLAKTPLNGKDGRASQVMAAYDEALVLWFAKQDTVSPEVQRQIDRYREIATKHKTTVNQGGN